MRPTLSLALLVALALPLGAQSKLYDRWGPEDWAQFGRSVAVVGDVDGDGGADYWVGAPQATTVLGVRTGVVHLVHGASGAILRTISGSFQGDNFGAHLAALNDLDGDGVDELLVGAPESLYVPFKSNWQLISGRGYVQIRSGRGGGLLREHVGSTYGSAFGTSAVDIGDVDGDQVHDYAIGAPRLPGAGTVHVFSGASGVQLREEFHSAPPVLGWGFHVAPCGDADGDGVADHLVSNVPPSTNFTSYSVSCLSGADGSTLWLATEPAASASDWGYRTLAIDDLTGDGVPEVVVGAKRANQFVGRAAWLDGASGAFLSELLGSVKSETFGASLALLGDLDGDGLAEVAIGSPSEGVPNGWAARGFFFFSGLAGTEVGSVISDPLHSLSFGTVIVPADVNGDGELDLIVGSPLEDPAFFWQAGRVEVYTDLLGP